jgi:hypothetical protein
VLRLATTIVAGCTVIVSGLAVPAAGGDADDGLYDDPAHWVCHPDIEDVCDSRLDATVVAADGTLTVEPFVPAAEPQVDCFYLYPTISRDPGDNSDLVGDAGEEGFAAVNQVAPLATQCRVFAPLYRQVTLAALAARFQGREVDPRARDVALADVTAAWHHYLAIDNDGRGVVLVGHSQGAGLLNDLIATEIERDPAQLDLLVAAYLAGSGVQVPLGEVVGGDFRTVPLCEADDQFGCVLTWASFRSTAPPPDDAFFGDGGDGTEAGCTNPAALGGGEAELAVRFPASARASILSNMGIDPADAPWLDPEVGAVNTPFVELPGLVSGRCVAWDGRSWLEVTVHGDPGDPRADDIGGDLTPPWGLHLIDVNLVIGDLQRLVASQSAAWVTAR